MLRRLNRTCHRIPRFIPMLMLLLAACQSHTISIQTTAPKATASVTIPNTPLPTPSASPTPTSSPTPLPTLFLLPAIDPNATLAPCDKRRPAADDLLAEVTASYGLDPNYVPPDLVRLGDYLPGRVTLPDMLLRQPAAAALGKLIKAMLADGLAPTILSSYRSYVEQATAHQRWVVDDPAHADQISALPGHSEHQLGSVVDFGSPEMPALTGSNTDKFSPLFAGTPEGRWLIEHAHEYGFTMTSPEGAEKLTGLAYEPWHYRYVGVEMASYLKVSGLFLAQYLLMARPVLPCLP